MTIVAPASAPTSVYLYFDNFDSLIYVGITARGARRQAEHNKTKSWWPSVHRQEVEHFETRSEALARESQLIAHHRPPYNVQQNPAHAQSRASYEAFRALMASAPSALDLARECGRAIPLTLIHRERERVEFATDVKYAPIVLNLSLIGQPRGLCATTRCGMVTDLIRHGGVVRIGMKVRIGIPINDPFARLRMLTVKDGAEFEIKNVQLAAQ
ncbi:GIY-YIG nuclease family protein [Nocardioides kribbensis]|uniref:GIY-YIG nuclease family protein n=1 Tax=Nocardioides kribbensis TaxID=305517 RepID=A0ABV1NZ33_9ACTN